MPRLDNTGPFGAGPMTGRGFGRCAATQESDQSANPCLRRAGFRNRRMADPLAYKNFLEEELKIIKKQMK